MADTDRTEGDQDLEAPGEDMDANEALIHLGKYSEAQHARPWEQWSFKEKANFCMDRIFLGVLVIFFFMLVAEFGYKMSFVINMRKVTVFMSDSAVSLFDWLFTQERQEELLELMRYVAAYLLAVLGGNTSPSAKDIKAILGSVGIEADDERLNKVISELSGKDINEVMNSGLSKLASVPAGGAVAAPAAAAGGAAGAGAAPAAAEEKKEEKKEESEESDEDMGFGLFD
ncbi:60S acidic ribosomal protein P2 [Nibea albiflora]|uniref:60S acidic ribosomal protein P2 n=1 Tax=Nibea albiflora TaxID=240163 RepID=A0ACB7F091_NIBAL|nr:60S acidic ribosomal protein P2 [Nibea albiflora]